MAHRKYATVDICMNERADVTDDYCRLQLQLRSGYIVLKAINLPNVVSKAAYI